MRYGGFRGHVTASAGSLGVSTVRYIISGCFYLTHLSTHRQLVTKTCHGGDQGGVPKLSLTIILQDGEIVNLVAHSARFTDEFLLLILSFNKRSSERSRHLRTSRGSVCIMSTYSPFQSCSFSSLTISFDAHNTLQAGRVVDC